MPFLASALFILTGSKGGALLQEPGLIFASSSTWVPPLSSSLPLIYLFFLIHHICHFSLLESLAFGRYLLLPPSQALTSQPSLTSPRWPGTSTDPWGGGGEGDLKACVGRTSNFCFGSIFRNSDIFKLWIMKTNFTQRSTFSCHSLRLSIQGWMKIKYIKTDHPSRQNWSHCLTHFIVNLSTLLILSAVTALP